MKQMKKTLSLILALVMLLSLGTTAFAGEMGAEETAVQRVEFETTPDFAVVTVYAGEDEVDAQEDGSYLLIPGEYTYNAAAEGYFPVEKNALTITTVTAETMKVEVVLDAVPVVEEPVVEDVVEAAAVVEGIAEEPVVEEPVVEEPVVEEPVVEEPVVEEPVVEEPVVEEPVIENAIVTQPADASVVSGDVAHFAVETTGEVASYQWQYSANGRRWSNLDARWYGSSEELNLTVSRSDSGYQFRVVVTFADGTIIHEKKAVTTWLRALQKIGLETICNNRRRHGAWHRVDGKDVCIVERGETVRSSDGNSPQTLIDGFYVMTQLSNTQKEKDLLALNEFMPKLGIKIVWDDDTTDSPRETSDKPVIDVEAAQWNLPIKEQFRYYLSRIKTEGTANGYTSTLDNAVRRFINQEVDANADSIFSYTTPEDVSLCIGILTSSRTFMEENAR